MVHMVLLFDGIRNSRTTAALGDLDRHYHLHTDDGNNQDSNPVLIGIDTLVKSNCISYLEQHERSWAREW